MGRHSRRGPASQGERRDSEETGQHPVVPGGGRRRREDEARGAGEHGAAGTPAEGVPQVRGGHPEQRERGGGWGTTQARYGDWVGDPRPGAVPRKGDAGTGGGRTVSARTAASRSGASPAEGGPRTGGGPWVPGPRREYVAAFEAQGSSAARRQAALPAGAALPPGTAAGELRTGAGGGRGRAFAFSGIAAAAVATVLAVVVVGHVVGGQDGGADDKAAGGATHADGAVSGAKAVAGPVRRPVKAPAPGYDQLMAERFPLAPDLKASGKFVTVPGSAKAPGTGHKYRYRVDIESGLDLDGALFADAVQKTLNDDRSWAHHGDKTFERISTGRPDFVITLASPGTTDDWCAKSGLDTSEENVSCDSAATERVMINAFRWAQGAKTYGPDAMHAYRQMLINHEVGHRLGHNHVTCRTQGALAPVMQQQTKSLDINGIKCRANPWVYPKG